MGFHCVHVSAQSLNRSFSALLILWLNTFEVRVRRWTLKINMNMKQIDRPSRKLREETAIPQMTFTKRLFCLRKQFTKVYRLRSDKSILWYFTLHIVSLYTTQMPLWNEWVNNHQNRRAVLVLSRWLVVIHLAAQVFLFTL